MTVANKRPYAAETNVSPDRSLMEIRATVHAHGGTHFGFLEVEGGAVITFRLADRFVRFPVRLPHPGDQRFWRTETGRNRTPVAAQDAYMQEVRRRWRIAAFGLKAKLELVAEGFSDFETEFLAYILLPNGDTLGDWAVPQVAEAYRSGAMPAASLLALPAASGRA